jgi:hypothetical protein
MGRVRLFSFVFRAGCAKWLDAYMSIGIGERPTPPLPLWSAAARDQARGLGGEGVGVGNYNLTTRAGDRNPRLTAPNVKGGCLGDVQRLSSTPRHGQAVKVECSFELAAACPGSPSKGGKETSKRGSI